MAIEYDCFGLKFVELDHREASIFNFHLSLLLLIINLKYPEVTTSFSLSREVVLDGRADPRAAAAAPAVSEAR